MKIKDFKKQIIEETNSIVTPNVFEKIRTDAYNMKFDSRETYKKPTFKGLAFKLTSVFALIIIAVFCTINFTNFSLKSDKDSIHNSSEPSDYHEEEPAPGESASCDDSSINEKYINDLHKSLDTKDFNMADFQSAYQVSSEEMSCLIPPEIYYFLYDVKINKNITDFDNAFNMLIEWTNENSFSKDYIQSNKAQIQLMFNSIKK